MNVRICSEKKIQNTAPRDINLMIINFAIVRKQKHEKRRKTDERKSRAITRHI